MQPARVIGHTTATVKHPSMQGAKLLIVQPYLTDNKTPDGYPQIATDNLGAGLGDAVIICNDSVQIRGMLKADNSPVRWFVAGIIDS